MEQKSNGDLTRGNCIAQPPPDQRATAKYKRSNRRQQRAEFAPRPMASPPLSDIQIAGDGRAAYINVGCGTLRRVAQDEGGNIHVINRHSRRRA